MDINLQKFGISVKNRAFGKALTLPVQNPDLVHVYVGDSDETPVGTVAQSVAAELEIYVIGVAYLVAGPVVGSLGCSGCGIGVIELPATTRNSSARFSRTRALPN